MHWTTSPSCGRLIASNSSTVAGRCFTGGLDLMTSVAGSIVTDHGLIRGTRQARGDAVDRRSAARGTRPG